MKRYLTEKKKYGFIDTNGKEIVPPKYDDVEPFSEGFAKVRRNFYWGLIDETGREIIEPKYTEWMVSSDEWIEFERYEYSKQGSVTTYGLINKTNKSCCDCV